ncbi:hypothetical protein LSH36_743g01033 [Paralvinella palmiformis]|uniref:Zinc finger PHD-type domain-containing protein n=1 Tax=Paralvinella palmiformis TaxID=53620 RepID=A0AAD9J283_9ANNE|nr:hypothetical protein LSH36_743g01033 [Paralvinella palmiformis]
MIGRKVLSHHSSRKVRSKPVSLICICCKLIDHIITSSVMSDLERHTILTDAQHGFRKQPSCEAPKVKKSQMKRDNEGWPSTRKRKAKNRFLNFCDIVLEYTQYEHMKQEELRENNASPMDSSGSTAESFTSESGSSYNMEDDTIRSHIVSSRFLSGSPGANDPTVPKDDSYDSVTCFCQKPFAGRPMIECSKCLTWIHLSCAKIRRNNIPEEFTCQKCRDIRSKKRKSNRMRIDKLSQSSSAQVLAALS